MKVLLVSHDFLPRHAMGTEIYTLHLGRELQSRGHDVHVFTTEKDIGRRNLSVTQRAVDGLPVHELVNNLFYNDFRETWDYPPAAESFGLLLDDYRPDVVHFMHLLYLSVACVEEVAKRGIPVFFTLHDYWLQCARFGHRKHRDGSICNKIDFDRCGDCMAEFKFKQTRLERATAKAVAGLRDATGIHAAPAVRGVANLFRSNSGGSEVLEQAMAYRPESDPPVEPTEAARARAAEIAERDRNLRDRLLPLVDRFLAPSEFLRERFLEWGIPPEQVEFVRTGIDLSPFAEFERQPRTERLRVAFIGTVAPHKGTHLLLEAWSLLPPELREKHELAIYGPLDHYPDYQRRIHTLSARCGANLHGRLSRPEVVERLGRIDLLVIPSIWYENSPLIILEALATRTPLLVSDLGGMAELVEDGFSGMHFRTGDAAHLAERLRATLTDPSFLDGLYGEARPVQPIQKDAEICEDLYQEARRSPRAAARR